ncbi:MAG: 23S rRNA (guanosine(2251)-2'-O)-methyltransferase RlmB, partial [Oscillospiraceae bacterium]
ARAAERGEAPLFLIADNIEDPHNLGAILRSADATGVHGVIVPKRHGVGLTPAVLRASAGAALHIPVARVPNLAAAIETLKERGVWIYAADMGGKSWCSVDYAGGVALMIGSEGSGISRLLLERSDVVVSLPMCGKVNSLNASVAAGVLLYEIARQRLGLLPFASDHNRGQGDRNGQ